SRLYKRSMIFHTKGAIDFGINITELAEYFLTSYLYKGDRALLLMIDAITYSMNLKGIFIEKLDKGYIDLEKILKIIINNVSNENTDFLKDVLKSVKTDNEQLIKQTILKSGKVLTSLKYINMIGNHIIELNN